MIFIFLKLKLTKQLEKNVIDDISSSALWSCETDTFLIHHIASTPGNVDIATVEDTS
jgi:hypothetical protein